MFNVGGGELLVILLIALIVLGPQRLPEAARKVGTAIGEVRRMANGFQSEIKAAFDDVDAATAMKPSRPGPAVHTPPPVPPVPAVEPAATVDAAATVDTADAASPGVDEPGPAELDPGEAAAPPLQPSGRDDAVA